ncbi:MAG: hypothetical protein AAF789_10890, partial [Bacteroidota bacterium]
MKKFLFIDESGSPDFFGRRKRPLWLDANFSPLLLLGMIETSQRKKLRRQIEALQQQVLADPLYNTIPSVANPNWFFHARGDHPEIRALFFNFIRQLDDLFCYIIIARKNPT